MGESDVWLLALLNLRLSTGAWSPWFRKTLRGAHRNWRHTPWLKFLLSLS